MDDLDLSSGSGDFIITSSSSSGDYIDNSSLTCAESSLLVEYNNSLSSSNVIAARIIQTIYGFLLIGIGVFLNGLILVLITKDKRLWTATFLITFQICLNDILLAFSLGLQLIPNNILGRLAFDLKLCIANGLLFFLASSIHLFLVGLFSIDIFIYIFAPFWYSKYGFKMIIVLSACCWGIVLIVSLIGLPGLLDCYLYFESVRICFISSSCSTNCTLFTLIRLFVLHLPVAMVAISSFISIYIKAWIIRRADRRTRGTKTTDVLSQELKALKILVALFVVFFLLTYLPATTAFIYNLYLEATGKYWADITLTDITYLIIFLNPLIIMSNKNIQEAFKKAKNSLKKLETQKFNSFIICCRQHQRN